MRTILLEATKTKIKTLFSPTSTVLLSNKLPNLSFKKFYQRQANTNQNNF